MQQNKQTNITSQTFDILFLLITTQRGRGGRAGQIGSGVNIADDDRDTCEDDSGPSSISARGLSPDCH